jgi:phosphatidylinositol dimannoside acyltransferase
VILDELRARAVDAGYAAGWRAVRAAPYGVTRRAFDAVAEAASVRNGAGARQLRANLRRVVGPDCSERDLDELVAAGLRSYARYWLETFRLPRMDKRQLVERIESTGGHYLDEALGRGRGAIVALPHMGNWDAAGAWLVAHTGSFAAVAERLRPESLFDRFVAYREGLGFEILPLTGGARPPLEVLRERLGENKVVCLVADRDLSRNGVEVDFFGEPARMPGGPALLAATMGAALLPVSMWFTDDGWGQLINPPLEVPEGRLRDQVPALTQSVARSFEKDIAAHPADWHMLQKLWVADLPARRAPAAAG